MAPSIPSVEPDAFTAGESVRWTRTFGDFPSGEGWVITYRFRGVGAFDIAGTPSGAGYLFSAAPSDTEDVPAGGYTWIAYAEKSANGVVTDRYEAANGVCDVRPNFAQAKPGDLQSHAERTLAIIVAALEGRLTADVETYSIAGRSVSKIPIAELRKLRRDYEWEVYRLKSPGRIGVPISTTFFPPDGSVGSPDPVVLPPWMILTRYGG